MAHTVTSSHHTKMKATLGLPHWLLFETNFGHPGKDLSFRKLKESPCGKMNEKVLRCARMIFRVDFSLTLWVIWKESVGSVLSTAQLEQWAGTYKSWHLWWQGGVDCYSLMLSFDHLSFDDTEATTETQNDLPDLAPPLENFANFRKISHTKASKLWMWIDDSFPCFLVTNDIVHFIVTDRQWSSFQWSFVKMNGFLTPPCDFSWQVTRKERKM